MTAVARVEAALQDLERAQDALNVCTVLRADEALAEARALDLAGDLRRGPLHGVPVVVKDLFDVAGLPTTGGCAAYRGRVATSDAAVVRSLRAAGAVVVAKTNQDELGAGVTGMVSGFGVVPNPYDPQRISGGSSSGSAVAVAAGLVPLAIGSDTGGSIRIPASFCGVTGLRPTPGRVSLAGAQVMSPGYDTAGPIASTAEECAVAFAALTGAAVAPTPPTTVAGLRIGLLREFFERSHPVTSRAVEQAADAFASLGAVLVRRDGPGIDERFVGFRHVWADVAYHYQDLWDSPEVGDGLRFLIDVGRRMSGLDYARSRAFADAMRERFAEALSDVDVLLVPATPYPAPRMADTDVAVGDGVIDVHRGGPSLLTAPVNEAGLPAVAFPVGRTDDGMPLGAQLIGAPYRDEQLLRIVAAYQGADS